MHKKTVLGIRLDRFIFVLASAPVLIACGILTGQPWYETALAVYSVLALMVLAEGRRGGPAFGIAFCLAYGALFFSKQTYGLAFFNTFFGASVYVFSLISWGKHKSGGAIEVKRLPPKGWAISLAASAAGFAVFYLLLRAIGSEGALLDSLSLAFIAPALVLLMLRYAENWLFHLAGILIVLVLWITKTAQDISSFNFVLIASLQTATNAIGLANWIKLGKTEQP